MVFSPRITAAIALVASACSAQLTTAETRKPDPPPTCEADQRLFGDWSSYRPTESGPSWHRVRFTCDCEYVAIAENADGRDRQMGRFAARRGQLHLRSPLEKPEPAATPQPFRFERYELYWQESGSPSPRRYRRTADLECEPPVR